MSFTYFSEPKHWVKTELTNRVGKILDMSKRNAWIRITSGVGDGMVILSNPSLPLFYAAGAIYGGVGAQPRPQGQSGNNADEPDNKTVITDRNGKEIEFKDNRWGRPRPIVGSISVTENNMGLSKKIELQITCFSLNQMIEIQKKFQEPGHNVFVEWGWNTKQGVASLVDISNVDDVVAQRNHESQQKVRSDSSGHYDTFLGTITGGGVSIEAGEKFVVNTKLTGVGDLAAYLQGQKSSEDTVQAESVGGESFWWVDRAGSNDKKRQFKYFFNDLPSYNRTENLKSKINQDFYINEYNFLNFDEELREDMGDETTDTKITYGEGEGRVRVELPSNTPLIGQERFVKLDVLFSAILQIRTDAAAVENKLDTERGVAKPIVFQKIPIRAHKRMFSTDKSKLVIPNRNMPDFGFVAILQGNPPPVLTGKKGMPEVDSSYAGISFPSPSSYDGKLYNELDKLNAYDWGYLEDLYVNYDFAKSVIESKTNDCWDMYIQILNGLSGAVNNFWNFDIVNVDVPIGWPNPKDPNKTETRPVIVDKSIACDSSDKGAIPLVLTGEQSIFLEASLDSNIPAAMMGSIVLGKASNGRIKANPDDQKQPTTGRGLFTTDEDWIAGAIKTENDEAVAEQNANSKTESDKQTGSKEDKIASAYAQFQSKAGVYPKIIDSSKDNLDYVNSAERMGFFTFDDPDLLRAILRNDTQGNPYQQGQVLLPIKFTFTIHGVSGFRRGDKFTIVGLPEQYSIKNGFFQVTGITHEIDGMMWKTQIEGQFRNVPSA